MDDSVTIDDSLVGKRVVSRDGDEIGIVSGVRSGTVYVDLDARIDDRLMAKLGWDDVSQTDYPLRAEDIVRVTADTVHLDGL